MSTSAAVPAACGGAGALAAARDDVLIVGVAETPMTRSGLTPLELVVKAVRDALRDARMEVADVGALLVGPTIRHDGMFAHVVGGKLGVAPSTLCKTMDCGGASACVAMIEGLELIRRGEADVVVVAAGDALFDIPREEMPKLTALHSGRPAAVAYDEFAQWYMRTYGVSREQLAAVPVYLSRMAARHPNAVLRETLTLDRVLQAHPVAPVTGTMECARRADGAAALVLCSRRVARARFDDDLSRAVVVSGAAQASCVTPAPTKPEQHAFPLRRAARAALSVAGLLPHDLDYLSLYDCFPVALLTALEDIGVAAPGRGAQWLTERLRTEPEDRPGTLRPALNTHGGLLCHGAPFSAAAVFLLAEAVRQVRGDALGVRVPGGVRHALAYGNGGVFSHAAVLVLSSPRAVAAGGPATGPGAVPRLPPTRLTRLLGIELPLMCAGMGGVSGHALAGAVSRAGGLGCMGCSTWTAEQAREEIRACRELAKGRPFGCNLIKGALHYDGVLQVILEERPRVFVTGLGVTPETVARCHAVGMLVGCVIGSVRHAEHAVAAGADFVIAQGSEGGGHTGRVALSALLPAVLDKLGHRVPVAAAGGICDARSMCAALYAFGADGVWMGSRFLLSVEATTVRGYKETVLERAREGDDPTVVSEAFTGRPCRVLRNKYTEENKSREVLPFLLSLRRSFSENAYHLSLGEKAENVDLSREFMPVGQCAPLLRAVRPAEEIVAALVRDVQRWLDGVRGGPERTAVFARL